MNDITIQEQFNNYLMLLTRMYNLNTAIDLSVDDTNLENYVLERQQVKEALWNLSFELVQSINEMGGKVMVYNHSANDITKLYIEDGRLAFEYK